MLGPAGLADTALARAAEHLVSLQQTSGCWEGEVVWCPMLLAQYVMVQRVIGRPLDPAASARIAQHFRVTQTSQGGWGLHREAPACVYVTALSYVALRLLGLGPEDPLTAPARRWLLAQPGGVLSIPSWGKFWLAMLGLYSYEGVNPCPPELFLLPAWLPFHPSRYYCHTRYIYTGISYLYGKRFEARRFGAHLGPVVKELRGELYPVPYETVDFAASRHRLAESDVHVTPGAVLRLAFDALQVYEGIAGEFGSAATLRRRALAYCFERILYEQKTSCYQALSPVNGLLNCLAIYSEAANHPDLAPSLEGLETWRWDDHEEGIRYAGARSNAWDTAFTMQAILEFPEPAAEEVEALRRAYSFLRDTQMTAELPGYRSEFRDPALGGWCFSDGRHRWPVSDCTAEALTAVLRTHQQPDLLGAVERISDERLRQAAEFILLRQNEDGGFGTYEKRRGSSWLEKLNPSEMFGNCMTERSYLECTASSVRALAEYRAAHPGSLREEIEEGVERGVLFLRGRQLPDGSFAGCWGINFTYAIFFAVEGLRAAGVPADDPVLIRAAGWLVSRQRADGGWGEHYSSSVAGAYVEHEQSQAAMTSWALLALLKILPPDCEPVTRGISWLCSLERPDGSWPRQAVNGVFFETAMLDYRLYKSYFPTWALARQARLLRSRP